MVGFSKLRQRPIFTAMMPKIIVLALLLSGLTAWVPAAHAQLRGDAYADSLEQAYANAKTKNDRLSTLSFLADWYLYRDLGKSMDYLLEADRLGWKNWKDAYLIAKSFGTAYQIVGYYDSAVYWQQLAHNSAIKAKNTRYEGITANNLANAYYGMGMFDSAYVYALKALGPSEKAGNKLGVALSKEFIAILEGEFGHMDSSYSYFLQSAALFKALGERNFEAMAYVSAIRPMAYANRYKDCWELIDKASAIAKAEPDPFLEGSLWLAKGHVQFGEDKYTDAWKSLDSSYVLFESLGALDRLATVQFERGRIKHALKDYPSAKGYFEPLIADLEAGKQWFKLAQIYGFLADGYAAQNNMPEAFKAMKKVDDYRDSLQFIANKSELAGMAIKYALDKSNTELRNVAQSAAVARKQFYAGIGVLLFGLAALSLIIWLISKNKRQTEKLNAQLASQNLFKDRLFASIGHDLRSPLAQSYAALRSLRRKIKDMPELAAGLAQVQAGQGHALQVTDDLLGWVALQWSGEKNLSHIDLRALVVQVIELYQSIVDDKNIQLELPNSKAPAVQSDEQAVALLLRNVVSNALKFSPANGRVRMAWGHDTGRPWCSISDNGKGFPEAWLGDLQQLALQNERLPSQQGSEGEPGTGFGLMLCASFARHNQIEVFLEKTDEGGACVRLIFPPTA